MASMRIPDSVLGSIVYVGAYDEDSDETNYGGTGFIFTLDEHEGKSRFSYHHIVTARHNIESASDHDSKGRIRVKFNTQYHAAEQLETNLDDWVYLDGEFADLAVLKSSAWDLRGFDGYTILSESIVTQKAINERPILKGNTIFYCGLIGGFGGSKEVDPTCFHGNLLEVELESHEVNDYPPMELYLGDIDCMKGLSGSPVFVTAPSLNSTPEKPKVESMLLGIIHGRVRPMNEVPHSPYWEKYPNSCNGIAFIVPSSKLLILLEQETLKNDRELLKGYARDETT